MKINKYSNYRKILFYGYQIELTTYKQPGYTPSLTFIFAKENKDNYIHGYWLYYIYIKFNLMYSMYRKLNNYVNKIFNVFYLKDEKSWCSIKDMWKEEYNILNKIKIVKYSLVRNGSPKCIVDNIYNIKTI